MSKTSFGQKIVLIILGLLLGAVLMEVGLRAAGFVLLYRKERANRISLGRKKDYVILCLGESTTAIGGEYSYPRLLEKILNAKMLGVEFSVINQGVAGTTIPVILSELERYLDIYRPDMVITMMGINDGARRRIYGAARGGGFLAHLRGLRVYKLTRLLQERLAYLLDSISAGGGPGLSRPGGEEEDLRKIEERSRRELESDPRNPAVYVELADWYSQQGRSEEAEELYRQAIHLSPDDIMLYYKLMSFFRNQGMQTKGEELFQRALEVFYREARADEVRFQQARFFNFWSQWEKASAAAQEAIDINPANIAAYQQLVISLSVQGKGDEAAAVLSRGLKDNPHDVFLLSQLGELYQTRKEWERAIKIYEETLMLTPNDPRLLGALGLCYLNQKKDDLAAECFNRADALRPTDGGSANYLQVKEIVLNRGIKLVCVQYPLRPLAALKRMLPESEGIIFVDNEAVFKEAVKKASYETYFSDYFAGDFGHCTPQGNWLLAQNIAGVIIREVFTPSGPHRLNQPDR